jgi:hypothetical protein
MSQAVLEPKKAPPVAAAAAGGSGGDMFNRDPRVEALMRMVANREDNQTPICSRFSTVRAQGPKGIDVETTNTIFTKNFNARLTFAEFVSEFIEKQGSLDSKLFDELLKEFQETQGVVQSLEYQQLTIDQRQLYIEAIRVVKDEFLAAFSEINADLAKVTLPDNSLENATFPNVRETHLSFAAMVTTIEEVDKCFHNFCSDSKFSDILRGSSLEEQFRAFKVARAACGIEETEQTATVIDGYAKMFGLAA